MQLGEKKLIVQRASVGAKGAMNPTAPVQIQVRTCYIPVGRNQNLSRHFRSSGRV